jgi:hypothetical protein
LKDLLGTITDNFSKLPKWAWGVILGGFVLVVFLSKNKSSSQVTYSPAPTYEGGGMETNKVSESEVSNRISEVVNGLTQKMAEDLNEQGSYFQSQLTEKESMFNQQLQAQNQQWTENTNALTSSWNETNNSLQNQLSEVASALKVIPPPAYTVGLGTGTGLSAGASALRSGNMTVVNSEIERANSVIAHRKSQGLDTTAQESYLANLLKGKK